MFGGGWGVGGRVLLFEMGWSGEASLIHRPEGESCVCLWGKSVAGREGR